MTIPLTRACRAFQDVLEYDLPSNLAAEHAQLRAENARLQAKVQQLQAAAVSPYGNHSNPQDPRYRLLTWKEFGEERNEKTSQLGESIAEAVDILQSARRDTQRLNGTPTYTRPLEEAHNAMCDAEALLEELDFEEDEEDEEDETKENN